MASVKKIIGAGGYTAYLSLSNTRCIKGMFSILVLTHHLYQYSGLFHNTYFGAVLQGLGYVSVAMFFFLSGYGLQISRQTRGAAYVKSIPKKRMLPLYMQSVFLIILYALLYIMTGREFSSVLIFQSFTWGETIIIAGWYLQAILVLYALYFLIYGIFGERGVHKNNTLYVAMFAALAAYALLNVVLGKSIVRYQSIFAFWFGILWCDYKNIIDEKVQKNWIASSCSALVLFAILFVTGLFFKPATLIAAPMFVLFALIVFMKLPVQCNVTRWLGKYYFEIYVMQGVSLWLFHSDIVNIENGWLYAITCAVVTLVLAVIIHPLFVCVYEFGQKNI